MSEVHIGKRLPERSGENHWNWKGGSSKNPYPIVFNKKLKLEVRKRDNFTCQLCGITEEEHKIKIGRVLSVNHIDFNKNNCDMSNLNSLCSRCNILVNADRIKWTKFFQEKLMARLDDKTAQEIKARADLAARRAEIVCLK